MNPHKLVDIAVIVILIVLYVLVFGTKGIIVDHRAPVIGLSSTSTVSVGVSTTAIKNASELINPDVAAVAAPAKPDLMEFKIFSDYPVPERFIAKSVSVGAMADFILLTEQGLQEKLLAGSKYAVTGQPKQDAAGAGTGASIADAAPQRVSPAPAAAALRATGRTAVRKQPVATQPVQPAVLNIPKKVVVPDVLTYPSVAKYVLESNKSYIYPATSTGSDVVLSIISVTPFEDKTVVRYSIENRSKSFFFIDSSQLLDAAGKVIITQKFGEDYVSPGKSETIYLIGKIESKQLKLKITAGGGTSKCLEIAFSQR